MKKRNRKLSNERRRIAKSCGYPWDWAYMLSLEKVKLKSMLDYFNQSDIVECAPIIRRDIRICLSLIDIIEKEGANDKSLNYVGYLNTNNHKRFWSKLDVNLLKNDYYRTCLRHEKAWHLYNVIRMYKMRNWWD